MQKQALLAKSVGDLAWTLSNLKQRRGVWKRFPFSRAWAFNAFSCSLNGKIWKGCFETRTIILCLSTDRYDLGVARIQETNVGIGPQLTLQALEETRPSDFNSFKQTAGAPSGFAGWVLSPDWRSSLAIYSGYTVCCYGAYQRKFMQKTTLYRHRKTLTYVLNIWKDPKTRLYPDFTSKGDLHCDLQVTHSHWQILCTITASVSWWRRQWFVAFPICTSWRHADVQMNSVHTHARRMHSSSLLLHISLNACILCLISFDSFSYRPGWPDQIDCWPYQSCKQFDCA